MKIHGKYSTYNNGCRCDLCQNAIKAYRRTPAWKAVQKRYRNKSDHKYRDTYRTIRDAAKDVPCKDCGNRFPSYVMDFDHIPERGKKCFALSDGSGKRMPENRLRKEIAKCDVICANCHRIRTFSSFRRESTDRPR